VTAPRFLNRERATDLLRQAGLAGVLLTQPLNVYYATSKTLVIERFSHLPQSAAIVPADPARPIALIASGFDSYFGGTDHGLPDDVQLYPIGGGHIVGPPVFPIVGEQPLPARELRRRRSLDTLRFHPTFAAAISAAAGDLGLNEQDLATDQPGGRGEDLMLHIRAVKTPDELALMRTASIGTHAAVLAGARTGGDSLRGLRQAIFTDLAARGLTPFYGNVDGVVDETYDEELAEGQCVMLDFVAHLGFYQSDIGRTLFIGEAPREAMRAARAIETVWEELRQEVRPGVRATWLHDRGTELLGKIAPTLRSAFNPHLVGLQHWDQPRQSLDGRKLDLLLEAGMVLSFDCPLLCTGIGGSIHMEDLMLVTTTGAEALHPSGDNIIEA
jgi:Xaa-Pro aminopeptidase